MIGGHNHKFLHSLASLCKFPSTQLPVSVNLFFFIFFFVFPEANSHLPLMLLPLPSGLASPTIITTPSSSVASSSSMFSSPFVISFSLLLSISIPFFLAPRFFPLLQPQRQPFLISQSDELDDLALTTPPHGSTTTKNKNLKSLMVKGGLGVYQEDKRMGIREKIMEMG